MRAALVLGAAICFAPSAARAEDDAQLWLTLTGDVKLDANDSLTGQIIYRSRPDELEAAGQRLLRAGISHKLDHGVILAFSYTHVQNFNEAAPDAIQHRFAQGISLPLGGNFDTRFQVEEILARGGDDIGVRARSRLRWVHPLDADYDVELQLSDELIWSVNDTDWGQNAGWSANRAAVAVHFKLNTHFGIAPNYLWQLVNRSTGPNRNDHVFGLTLDTHF